MLPPDDPRYPAGLRDLGTPPTLWVRGAAPTGPMVAVVGTRQPDRIGTRLAAGLSEALVERGYGVVSGLAAGIDTAAHRAALDAGGRTWAVLGCGVDVEPSADAGRLAERVTGAGGLLAEVPPGTPVSTRALVARDRLQSAMSLVTIIVQSDLRSGTMHTARFAVVQSRPLVVLAPPDGTPVGRPNRPWDGNAALCDRRGCDPALLHATGAAGRRIAGRRPVADLVLPAEGPWTALWELIDQRQVSTATQHGQIR